MKLDNGGGYENKDTGCFNEKLKVPRNTSVHKIYKYSFGCQGGGTSFTNEVEALYRYYFKFDLFTDRIWDQTPLYRHRFLGVHFPILLKLVLKLIDRGETKKALLESILNGSEQSERIYRLVADTDPASLPAGALLTFLSVFESKNTALG